MLNRGDRVQTPNGPGRICHIIWQPRAFKTIHSVAVGLDKDKTTTLWTIFSFERVEKIEPLAGIE